MLNTTDITSLKIGLACDQITNQILIATIAEQEEDTILIVTIEDGKDMSVRNAL